MDNTTQIINYLRQCPQLEYLQSLAGTEEMGKRIVIYRGASPVFQHQESFDVNGNYEGTREPYPSIFEDYQINCYEYYDPRDTSSPENNVNVLSYEDVEGVCDWIKEQDKIFNFPNIDEDIISVECEPFKPQQIYLNADESTIGYAVGIRVRYVNWAERRSRYFECPY